MRRFYNEGCFAVHAATAPQSLEPAHLNYTTSNSRRLVLMIVLKFYHNGSFVALKLLNCDDVRA